MNAQNLESAVSAFCSAHEKLRDSIELIDEKAVSHEHYGMFEDAVVKRFEIAFEYWWKMVKVAVDFQGAEAPGPRPAIQEAIRFGWIEDPEFWAEALDARNGSVHDYFGISRGEYLKIVRKFIKASDKVRERVQNLSK